MDMWVDHVEQHEECERAEQVDKSIDYVGRKPEGRSEDGTGMLRGKGKPASIPWQMLLVK